MARFREWARGVRVATENIKKKCGRGKKAAERKVASRVGDEVPIGLPHTRMRGTKSIPLR